MATQLALAKKQRALQEETAASLAEVQTGLAAILPILAEMQESLHKLELAMLRVERKFKGAKDEE